MLAHVHLGSRRWVLEPGQSVSFGRGSPCDIRVAHDPVDEHVSRRAGVVEHLGEDVVVRNESATRTLIFSPARGRERVIHPGEAVTCLPHREFLVGVLGRGGNHYVLQVVTEARTTHPVHDQGMSVRPGRGPATVPETRRTDIP